MRPAGELRIEHHTPYTPFLEKYSVAINGVLHKKINPQIFPHTPLKLLTKIKKHDRTIFNV